MTDIKIPVSWLKENGIEIVVDDGWVNTGRNFAPCKVSKSTLLKFNDGMLDYLHITSFTYRENTGEQPVRDWVPVDVTFENGKSCRRIARNLEWYIAPSNDIYMLHNIKAWKPDIEGLYKIYMEGQEVLKINHEPINTNLAQPDNTEKYCKIFKDAEIKTADDLAKFTGMDKAQDAYEKKFYAFVFDGISELEYNYDKVYMPVRAHPEAHLLTIPKNVSKHSSWDNVKEAAELLRNASIKKETKLKLTKDDIGKDFECDSGEIYKVSLVNGLNSVVENNSGVYFRCYLDGSFAHTKRHKNLIKRHEPRWWLKDLPDVGLFNYDWWACDKEGSWYCYEDMPRVCKECYWPDENKYHPLGCYKDLPLLKGDEWKDSCVNLREWQENNT